MVKHISSVGRNGVQDWVLLRATGVIILLYTIYMVGFCVFGPELNFATWSSFFAGTFTKVFTMLALLSVLVHAWIGLWQVLTDYVKPAMIRAILQLAVIVTLLSYFFSGFFILWGV